MPLASGLNLTFARGRSVTNSSDIKSELQQVQPAAPLSDRQSLGNLWPKLLTSRNPSFSMEPLTVLKLKEKPRRLLKLVRLLQLLQLQLLLNQARLFNSDPQILPYQLRLRVSSLLRLNKKLSRKRSLLSRLMQLPKHQIFLIHWIALSLLKSGSMLKLQSISLRALTMILLSLQ